MTTLYETLRKEVPGLEGASFAKDDKFKTELIGIFGRITIRIKNNKKFDDEKDKLVELVKDHFNINITLPETGDYLGPMVQLPTVVSNNVQYAQWLDKNILKESTVKNSKKYTSMDAKNYFKHSRKDIITGFVDLKNNYIGGDFAKPAFACEVYPNFLLLVQGVNPDELAAAFTHEIGHIFYCYALMYAQRNMNFVINEFNRDFIGIEDDKIKYTILKQAKQAGYDLKEHEEAIVRSKNPTVLESILVAHMEKDFESELGFSPFQNTTAEICADNFAVRMGFGSELTSCLKKLTALGIDSKATPHLILLIALGAAGAMGGFMSVIGLLLACGISVKLTEGIIPDINYSYPDIQARLERIVDQEFNRFNTVKLTRDEKRAKIAEIRNTRAVIKDMGNIVNTSLMAFKTFLQFVTMSKYRGFTEDQNKQHELEQLINSKLGAVASIIETDYKEGDVA